MLKKRAFVLNNNINKSCKYQNGFTLIELMISLVLGLLISAAVMQVYLANVKSATIQQAGSDIIDSNIFGMEVLENHIRLANLGLAGAVNDSSEGSGIVLTSDKNLKQIGFAVDIPVPNSLLTKTGDMTPVGSGNHWAAKSLTDTPSGQLTIQFRAPQDMFDCQGQAVLGPREVTINGVKRVIGGQIVIERYYLNNQENNANKLSLYCDAGKYLTEDMDDYKEQGRADKPSTVLTNKNIIKDFGDKGDVIVQNMDYFDVLLGAKNNDESIQYYTVDKYLKLNNKPNIISVKIGGIIRSNNIVQTSELNNKFSVFDKAIKLKTNASESDKKYLRFVFQNEIALRNARQKELQ